MHHHHPLAWYSMRRSANYSSRQDKTWPVYYWLGVFKILKLSRTSEEWEEHKTRTITLMVLTVGHRHYQTLHEKVTLHFINHTCVKMSTKWHCFEELCQPADFEARRRLRSASSSSLVVRRTRLSTVGDRAFPVAAARIWNGLPPHVTSASSQPVFRSRLKTHLFRRCFPWLHLLFFVVPVKWLVIIGHVNRSFYLLTIMDKCHIIAYRKFKICSLSST